MASSPVAYTAAIDDFADRSNARYRRPERHSSVHEWSPKRLFFALNAGGAIRKMKPDRHKQNTRQRPPRSSSGAPFRPQTRCRHTCKIGPKDGTPSCTQEPPRHPILSPPGHNGSFMAPAFLWLMWSTERLYVVNLMERELTIEWSGFVFSEDVILARRWLLRDLRVIVRDIREGAIKISSSLKPGPLRFLHTASSADVAYF